MLVPGRHAHRGDIMPWVYLMGAILLEVMGTTNLKVCEGFTRPVPSMLVAIGYAGAFYLLSRCVRDLDIAVAYAVWSGVGTALIALVGRWTFGETLNGPKIACIVLILTGTMGLHMLSLSKR